MRINGMIKKISVLCAGALMIACADMAPQPSSAPGADLDYDQGRVHHLAGRYQEAIAAYRAVLVAAPGHARARNALAAALARQGDFAQAIPIWQALTAELTLSSGPASAYLFANLGHAHQLEGDYGKAILAFEKACLLDPLDHRAWQRLGEALRHLGQHERAELMFRQASALREHDFQRDYAAAGGSAVAAIEAAVAAPTRPASEWAVTEVRTAADGTLELLRLPPARELAQAPRAPDPVPPQRTHPALVLLEIRNGNGVTGMARSLSRQVSGDGLFVTRLSNEKGFKVRRTRIEHVPAYRAVAERLAGRFDDVQLIEIAQPTNADLRLVLGQDVAHGKFVLRPAGRDSQRYAVAMTLPKAP